MNDGYRATILDDARGFLDPLGHTVLLAVQRRNGSRVEYLRSDGNWQSIADGTLRDDDYGLRIPAEAIEAIAVAIQEFQGHTSHADTEASVLREWLTVERARVDAVLAK